MQSPQDKDIETFLDEGYNLFNILNNYLKTDLKNLKKVIVMSDQNFGRLIRLAYCSVSMLDSKAETFPGFLKNHDAIYCANELLLKIKHYNNSLSDNYISAYGEADIGFICRNFGGSFSVSQDKVIHSKQKPHLEIAANTFYNNMIFKHPLEGQKLERQSAVRNKLITWVEKYKHNAMAEESQNSTQRSNSK